jgi:multidrug efflux pump subunit AcrA (membrane-fusion protein)
MAAPSDRISQLKIDRSVTPPAQRAWLLPAVVAAAVAGALAWWLFVGTDSAAVLVETDVAHKPPSVAAASSVLDASGYVVARRQATVSSKVTGKVREIFIEEGMRVEKDQVVATLDDTTEQAQLALAVAQADSARAALAEIEAQLRNARLERDRLRDLADRDLTSKSSLDTAEAVYDELAARLETGRENVEVALSNVALAEDAVANMTIRAPFAGMVVTKNAQPGEMISPVSAGGGFTRTGICTIIDTDSLEIEVEVIAIVPTADRQKATVRVRIGFLERDERVLRDMGVKVSFLGGESHGGQAVDIQGVLISGEALRSDGDGDFVWLVRRGAVERRSIILGGARDRPQILVSNGLVVGDTVVRTAEKPMTSGQAIKTGD